MSRADDDYDDDPPRRRRRPRDDDDYEDDDRPRRGNASGGDGTAAAAAGGSMLLVILVAGGVGLLCCGGIAVGLLLPAVQKVREAAARAKDMNNFKQVSLGFHNYNDTKGQTFPPADGDLSWRVHLLPFVEQASLHGQFDLDQKWDSPKNRPLADTRVPVYVSALDGEAFKQTRIRVFTGPDTWFPPGEKPLPMREVTDGISNTLLAVESAETVPWPQPRELAYSKTGPLPALGHPDRPGGFIVAMGDGSVRFVARSVNENTIRGAITPAGKEPPPDF